MDVDGRQVRLVMLDTNVIGSAVSDPPLWRRLIRRCAERRTVPSISLWTALELRRRGDVWDRFVAAMPTGPLVVLQFPSDLLAKEIEAYPRWTDVSPAVYAFNPMQEGPTQDEFWSQVFDDPARSALIERWEQEWKEESLQAMVSLKENFPPANGRRYTLSDGDRFLEMVTFQYLARTDLEWTRRMMDEGGVDVTKFPSIRASAWSAFYRFYLSEDRTPERQDVFDILNAAVMPYVEEVITERFQAHVLREAGRRDPSLGRIEVAISLADLRADPE